MTNINFNRQKRQIFLNASLAFSSGNSIFGKFAILINLLAVVISWFFNKSVLWAIFHFFTGWMYLLYCLLSMKFANGMFLEILQSFI